MRIGPHDFLYPLIQSWPIPSKTSETLLFTKEANGVLYLNQLRHHSNSALTLGVPYTNKGVVAIKVALGQSGITEGRDYRNVEVLGRFASDRRDTLDHGQLVFVNNGEGAVKTVRSMQDLDLVLMDLKMPVMDGFEATRLIKQLRPELPVIAQTAFAFIGDKEKALLA